MLIVLIKSLKTFIFHLFPFVNIFVDFSFVWMHFLSAPLNYNTLFIFKGLVDMCE